MNIIDITHKPVTEGKLFFGDYGKYSRIDKVSIPKFRQIADIAEANTWFINEIDFAHDSKNWQYIPEVARRMFKLNIIYQTLMDSGVTNVYAILADLTSLPELQYLYKKIDYEEAIHAMSYSSGISQVFGAEAEQILDIVYDDKLIQSRMQSEQTSAEKLLQSEPYTETDYAKKALLEMLLYIYFLEGVKFPFSFFITWAINNAYNNSIQGFSKLLKLIAHDELTVHVITGREVLNLLRNDTKQGFKYLFESGWFDEIATKIAKETAELEFKWSSYLLENGEIPGYNAAIGEHFIKYWVDYRLSDIKCKTLYNEQHSDIIEWFNKYRNLNATRTALQEADNTNYQKGALKNDFDSYDWTAHKEQ